MPFGALVFAAMNMLQNAQGIIFYSNFCNFSKTLLVQLATSSLHQSLDFACVDNIVVEEGKKKIVLDNGRKIILPTIVTQVPALLLLTTFKVYFGNDIYRFLVQPHKHAESRIATQNNMDPIGMECSKSMSGVVSDNYSSFDLTADNLNTHGEGGMSQRHGYSYFDEEYQRIEPAPEDLNDRGSQRLPPVSVEDLQRQREMELQQFINYPPRY